LIESRDGCVLLLGVADESGADAFEAIDGFAMLADSCEELSFEPTVASEPATEAKA